MPLPSYPIFGSQPDLIPQQIYNWANADRNEQANNIQRRTAWDAQAIQNRNNYFQMQQQQEAQDYARQQAVQQENYRRQQEAEREALVKYKFAEDQKLNRDYLTKQDEWAKGKQATQALNDNFKVSQDAKRAQEAGNAWLIEQLGKGEHIDKTPDELAQLSGSTKEYAAQVQEHFKNVLPDQFIAKLNSRKAELVAKTDPVKLNWDGIAGLKATLPAWVQPLVTFNPTTKSFERADAPYNMASPAPQTVNMDEQQQRWNTTVPDFNFTPVPSNTLTDGTALSDPAVNYNFGTQPVTATMPAPTPKQLPPEGTIIRQNGIRYRITNGQAVEI